MTSCELHHCLKGGIYLHRKSEKERNVAWLVPYAPHGTARMKRLSFDVRTPEPNQATFLERTNRFGKGID